MELILLMVMARGQRLYPIHISHFVWMGNHFHFILTGRASSISPFMGYVQGEVAKYVKLLFPKRFQSCVWPERFHEQQLYTAHDVLQKIAYLYSNPARADLVHSIVEYPGSSSWKMFVTGTKTREVGHVRLGAFVAITHRLLGLKDSRALSLMRSVSEEKETLTLSPYLWRRYFAESATWTAHYTHQRILTAVEEQQEEARVARGNRGVMGAHALGQNDFSPHYEPTKTKERTPFLQCSDKEMRETLIESYRAFCAQCREAWQQWKKGLCSLALYPKGAYRPSLRPIQLTV